MYDNLTIMLNASKTYKLFHEPTCLINYFQTLNITSHKSAISWFLPLKPIQCVTITFK